MSQKLDLDRRAVGAGLAAPATSPLVEQAGLDFEAAAPRVGVAAHALLVGDVTSVETRALLLLR